MHATVRLAKPEDASLLRRFNLAFNGVDRSEAAIASALCRNGEIVAIAELDGIPAGFCCAQVHFSFCYPTPVAEITEMYVQESCRRKGCASAMLRFVEKYVQTHFQADECHLLTGMDNLAAQEAYRASGYCMQNELYLSKKIGIHPES